jgi:hypothetical protein
MAATEMLILYGSQTGTAEELAEELAASASDRGIALRWLSMEDYDVRTGPHSRSTAPACLRRRLPSAFPPRAWRLCRLASATCSQASSGHGRS